MTLSGGVFCLRSRDLTVYIFSFKKNENQADSPARPGAVLRRNSRTETAAESLSPRGAPPSSVAPNLLAVITYLHVCLPLECELLEGRNPVFIHLCVPVPSTVPGSW